MRVQIIAIKKAKAVTNGERRMCRGRVVSSAERELKVVGSWCRLWNRVKKRKGGGGTEGGGWGTGVNKSYVYDV